MILNLIKLTHRAWKESMLSINQPIHADSNAEVYGHYMILNLHTEPLLLIRNGSDKRISQLRLFYIVALDILSTWRLYESILIL